MPNKKIAENYATRVWDDRDLTAIDELIDKNCIIHSLLGDFKGPALMKTVVETWLKGFPDLSVKNLAVIGEKDLVVIQWEAKGTHLGEFKGLKPTGKFISYAGTTIYRILNEKIVEYWAYIDMHHILKQLSFN